MYIDYESTKDSDSIIEVLELCAHCKREASIYVNTMKLSIVAHTQGKYDTECGQYR